MFRHRLRVVLLALLLATSPLQVFAEPKEEGYVFSVTVESAQQLDLVLSRAEDLRELLIPTNIVKLRSCYTAMSCSCFRRTNYSSNQSMVERARLLDQEKIIDIKACQTMMRILEIEQSELPGFIEQVPFAPAEIERLQREEGFTRL